MYYFYLNSYSFSLRLFPFFQPLKVVELGIILFCVLWFFFNFYFFIFVFSTDVSLHSKGLEFLDMLLLRVLSESAEIFAVNEDQYVHIQGLFEVCSLLCRFEGRNFPPCSLSIYLHNFWC